MSSCPTYRILAVDDNPSIHEDYRKVLLNESTSSADLDDVESLLFGSDAAPPSQTPRGKFDIDSAEHGQQGLELVKKSIEEGRPYSVAFIDMRMPPGWNGVETTRRIWELDPDLPVVFCTAYTDYSWEEMVAELDRSDQFLILKKPFDNVELRQLAFFQSEKKRLAQIANLKKEQLERMVESRTREISNTRHLVFSSLARLAESRDACTGKHLERIQHFTMMLGTWLNENGPYQDQLTPKRVRKISESSVLHDIGKVGIPDAILLKPGRLTPDEFTIMTTHVDIGATALKEAAELSDCCGFLRLATEIAQYHHERFDGSGYPESLSGQNIPLSARIVAVADVFDALTTKRVYKDAIAPEDARELINAESGMHFDPAVVAAFNGCWLEFEASALANQVPAVGLPQVTSAS